MQTVTVPATYTHKLYLPIIANSTPPVNLAPARVTYRFNEQQVAVREGVTLTFVHGDHIGSASLVTSITGTVISELRYTPYGETRYSIGDTPTNKRFTSQEQQAGIGLYSFGARFYDALLGRFISADSVVPRPGNPQSLNRYAYCLNSPY
ncbi:MAG: RHS repeat-associated core domain-containing protein [Chloroflexi bacterium]|nr:RHS repeat-associated core domain-containing protein [Chloroflexota bacterium]